MIDPVVYPVVSMDKGGGGGYEIGDRRDFQS